MNKKQLTHWFLVIVIGIALALGLQFVRAWTEPSQAPPNGNVGAPINTGSIDQTKLGDICTTTPNGTGVKKCLSATVGVNICGNHICEGAESTTCPSDCPAPALPACQCGGIDSYAGPLPCGTALSGSCYHGFYLCTYPGVWANTGFPQSWGC